MDERKKKNILFSFTPGLVNLILMYHSLNISQRGFNKGKRKERIKISNMSITVIVTNIQKRDLFLRLILGNTFRIIKMKKQRSRRRKKILFHQMNSMLSGLLLAK